MLLEMMKKFSHGESFVTSAGTYAHIIWEQRTLFKKDKLLIIVLNKFEWGSCYET